MADSHFDPRDINVAGDKPARDRLIPPGASATGWLAFEDRVQQRRAQARLEAARSAIADGRLDDAAAALDEARMLLGDTAEVVELLGAVAAARTTEPIAAAHWAETRRYLVRLTGAAALLCLGLLAARTSDWLRPRLTSRPIAVEAVLPPSSSSPAASPLPVARPPAAGADLSATVASPTGVATPIGTAGRLEPARPRIDARRPAPARPLPVLPRRTEPVADGEVTDEYVFSGRPNATASGSRVQLDQVRSAVMRPPTPAAVPASEASNGGLRIPDSAEQDIRDALQQYRQAYTSLDAHAARAVWPSLDEQALARAFQSLSAQKIVFEGCDVDVRGVRATADCRGEASYVRKVGNRDPQTEARQWRFELAQSNGAWRIAKVEASR